VNELKTGGSPMEALLLIAIVFAFADSGNGKAGW
jgi:hypothetical protein